MAKLVTLLPQSGNREQWMFTFYAARGIPAHGMVLPILKSSSTKPVWKCLHKYSQRCVSTVILNLVKLTMKSKCPNIYARSVSEPQETPHVSACLLAPLPSSWEYVQASQMMEVRHMEQGLVVPVTSAKTNCDGPTPRHLSKHSQKSADL